LGIQLEDHEHLMSYVRDACNIEDHDTILTALHLFPLSFAMMTVILLLCCFLSCRADIDAMTLNPGRRLILHKRGGGVDGEA
jgi:hypothetical protein